MSARAQSFRSLLLAAATALALALALAAPAQATVSTAGILSKTISALPACLKYQVKGVCFFLQCDWGCRIRTSIRVSHYVPDAIVSTYHEPLTHPWAEVGKPLATTLSGVGSAFMGLPIDSAGSTAQENKASVTFKSADAIGNPAGMLYRVATQGLPDLPSSFGVPGPQELAKFPSQELPRIQRRWMSVPSGLIGNLTEGAASLARAPGELMGKLQGVMGSIGGMTSGAGGSIDITKFADTASSIAGVDLGPLKVVMQVAEYAAGYASSTALFCPGSASIFTLHFQSDLDAFFWRDVIPLELLYPESWIPTLGEVSTNPAVNTWGGRYPRTGSLVQQHPVKASAVLAERVGDIIRKSAQPHIYKPLTPGMGFQYFNLFGDTPRWQMLSPSSTGCVEFGTNDSLGVTAFGDYKTSDTEGYVWNMWNKYDCCQKRGAFLFSIPP